MRGKGKLIGLVFLSVLALLMSFFQIPMFLDTLKLSFGAVSFFIALELLGLVYAAPIALIVAVSSAITQDLYFTAVTLLEFSVVSLLVKRYRLNLLISDLLFWILLGIPIYSALLAYLGLGKEAVLTISLKSAVNGLINVIIASLVILLLRYHTGAKNVHFREVVFTSLFMLALSPLFIDAALDSKGSEREMINKAKEDTRIAMENVKDSVTYWLEMHLNAVRELANRLVVWGPENREQLQKDTEAIRRAFKDFHACYIADRNATTIAFYPEVNPKGKYMIGTSFNYRSYYKRVKETLEPTFTEVFVAKFALRPVIGIAVPAVREGQFLGYAYCGLNLDYVRDVIEEFSIRKGTYITLIDKKGRVITSTRKGIKPMDEFKSGEVVPLKGGLFLSIKERSGANLDIEKYLNSYFYSEDKLKEDLGWRVVTEIEVRPYMMSLFRDLSAEYMSIMVLALISFFMGRFISGLISMPIERLSTRVTAIADNIERNPHIDLPDFPVFEINRLAASFEDMAKKAVSYMEELKRLAYFDPLTGLPNRTLLRDRLLNAIANAKRSGKKVAVLFIDLDYFKTVNDTMGHEVGDIILVQVAKRLSSVFREIDTVARFGGDEFVAVIQNVEREEQIVSICERVLSIFKTPFDANGEEVYLSASIGIALYPDNGDEPTVLIKNADMAMYKAKEEGKMNFAFFSEEMNRKAHETLIMKSKLHRALERGEFLLHYQPVYRIQDEKLVGFEALLRWKSPEGSLISPSKFIPLLEEMGLIREVGRWVMREAFKRAKRWSGVFMSLNVSPSQFLDRRFVNRVVEVLKETEAPASRITLEITETSLMQNPEDSIRTLKRLKSLGFKLAVDDFGTGYSSLSYLKKLPLDIIKVDMTFIQNVVSSNVDRAIISSIVTLSKSLGLSTLAEGVETREQLQVIKELGCDLAQGYYFGKPMAEEEAEALLRKEKGL